MSEQPIVPTPTPGTNNGEPTPPINPPNPPAPSLEERLKQSGREALVLKAERDKLQEQIGKLTTTTPPTDDELKAVFPEWEYMTAGEQAANRETLILRKQVATMQKTLIDVAETQHWQRDLQRATSLFPKLIGHEAEFRAFCYKNPGVKDIKLLANAFLNEVAENTPPATPPPPPPPSEDEILLEKGAGGPEAPVITTTATEMTAEEAKTLRTKNPQEYNRLAQAKQLVIKND